jgi:DNA-binding transcriptional regulator PaaX
MKNKKRVKGEILLKILDELEMGARTIGNLAMTLLAGSDVGYSLYGPEPKYRKTFAEEIKEKLEKEDAIKRSQEKEKKRVWNMVYWLKKQGFIRTSADKRLISITSKGRIKKQQIKNTLAFQKPISGYEKEKSTDTIIICFDVPEKEKHKRDWLRAVISNLGFNMLQKSVWIGKIKIPAELLSDLQQLKLLNYVEIFAISKSGTIRSLV